MLGGATIHAMKWQRTLILFAISVAVAVGLQLFWQTPAGWIILALATGGLLIDRRRQASRVAQWAEGPDADPPAGIGAWEEVVAALYRHNNNLKLTRDELQQTNAAIMSAAQALPMGAVTLNREFQIRWFNREKLWRLKSERDIGQNLLNLLRAPEFAEYAAKSDWPSHVVVRLSWGSGQDQTVMMQLVPYALDQILLLTRDLTQIERLETIRRDFVANVSHEMRTPLTVLSGFLETLIEAPSDALSEDRRSHYLHLMQDQTRRMTALVADLLTVSDLESTLVAERVAMRHDAHLDIQSKLGQGSTFSLTFDPSRVIRKD